MGSEQQRPVDVVVPAAGSGDRLGTEIPKAFVEIAGVPMLVHALRGALTLSPRRLVVTVPAQRTEHWERRIAEMEIDSDALRVVAGGDSRQESVRRGVEALADEGPEDALVLVHDAARPCASPRLWASVAEAAQAHGAAVPTLPSADCLKRIAPDGSIRETLTREEIVRVQTPQGFRRDWLLKAHRSAGDAEAYDDAELVERIGHLPVSVPGEPTNLKVTVAADLAIAAGWIGGVGGGESPDARSPGAASTEGDRPPPVPWRIGTGYDIHPLVEGRRLVLGGVEIEHDRGLDGHSDADVLAHAITDAILGAAGSGDIGMAFPASEERWRDADSLDLLRSVVDGVAEEGWRVGNVDATILAEAPRLVEHLDEMRGALARRMRVPVSSVNVKATRGERLGPVGRGEGIAAHAVALLVARR